MFQSLVRLCSSLEFLADERLTQNGGSTFAGAGSRGLSVYWALFDSALVLGSVRALSVVRMSPGYDVCVVIFTVM